MLIMSQIMANLFSLEGTVQYASYNSSGWHGKTPQRIDEKRHKMYG